MNKFNVGDKVKFNRETFNWIPTDSPELLEIVAQEKVGEVIVAKTQGILYEYRVVFPTPSPFKGPRNETMAINANSDELILVESKES